MRWGGDDEYPDLGCELLRASADYGSDTPNYESSPTYYKHEFKDDEDLITSEIFQKHLGLALAHKDKIIRQLQEEILNGK